jgi:hypothetical protein
MPMYSVLLPPVQHNGKACWEETLEMSQTDAQPLVDLGYLALAVSIEGAPPEPEFPAPIEHPVVVPPPEIPAPVEPAAPPVPQVEDPAFVEPPALESDEVGSKVPETEPEITSGKSYKGKSK